MKNKILIAIFVSVLLSGSSFALTLQESLDVALQQNPSIKSAKSNLEVSQTRLYQATGAFFPAIKLAGNYGRSYSDPSTVQITATTSQGAVSQTYTFGFTTPYNSKSYSASLSQPIFVGALFPGYNMAARSVNVSEQDLRKAIQDTTFNVTVTYYGVLASKEYIKLCEDSLQTAKTHHDQVARMLRNGVAAQADFLRAEVRVANAELALTRSYNSYETTKNAFNNALGIDLDTTVEVSGKYEIPKLQVPNVELLLSTAYANRPDWLSFVFGKEIAEQNLNLAKTAYLPTVYLSGNSAYQDTTYPTFDNKVNSWSIAGSASWTLFDGFTIYNKVREAAASLNTQIANEEQVKNSVEMEVKDAFYTLKTAMAVIATAQKAVVSAKESEKVSTMRYNSGVGTNLEVIDAQESLTQARNEYLKSIYDLEVAKARINKNVGTKLL
ncbi:MAG: TolC family protein [Candidatus Margulisiibacteriota bacterium]